MSEKNKAAERHNEYQQKYVYYIIALSVTAIGFSIYQSTGHTLTWYKIPLGIAILCWGLSIHKGLTYMRNWLDMLANNVDLLSADEEKDLELVEEIIQSMDDDDVDGTKLWKWQQNFFYIATSSFIIWHILEMYKTTLLVNSLNPY